MPRTKGYIRSEALEKARDAFWQHGYDALGVRAIERSTNLNRFAIQTEFGGKEGLFLEALDNYTEEAIRTILDPISEGGIDSLTQFFVEAVTVRDNDPRDFGCLMVNTAIENASLQNAELKKRTDDHYAGMLKAFSSALKKARDIGELHDDIDLEEAASFLLGLAMGMQVYNRMNGSVAAARHQASMAVKILESWKKPAV